MVAEVCFWVALLSLQPVVSHISESGKQCTYVYEMRELCRVSDEEDGSV